MTRTLYLKPAKDKLIRDPATGQPLPAHGAGVASSPFWHTALRVGDVEKTTAEAIAEAEKASPEEAAVPAQADKTTARSKPKD